MIYLDNLSPAERYLRAARAAGWLKDFSKAQALACGCCIYLEQQHESGRPVKRYRRSLYGITHSIGTDDRLPLRPFQLKEVPLDAQCPASTEGGDPSAS